MSSYGSWGASDIPSQEGHVAVVTGSNSGIGFETARALANRGATVIMACRNRKKALAAADAISAEGVSIPPEVRVLDLSSLESVASFADELLADHQRIDLLINNAGVMMPPKREVTADGFELQIGTNHLGHFALTARLFPALAVSPAARVVTVSSQAHRMGAIDFSDLQFETRRYRRASSYGQSKLANLLFTFELARRLSAAGSSVSALAAHPGWTATELQRHSAAMMLANKFFAMKRADGALPTLRAATDSAGASGDYYGPGGFYEMRGAPVRVGASRRAKNADDARRLWQLSEELTGVTFDVSTPKASAVQ